jgi:crossover junction endodeoxyribonuclease RusA
MQRLRLVLPLPPKVLSPNARCHWGVKSRAVKAYRWAARIVAMSEWDSTSDPLPEADIVCVFHFKDKRRRDRDNLLASMKSAFDGIADAGIVADDSSFRHEVQIGEPSADPHVEIIISERVTA